MNRSYFFTVFTLLGSPLLCYPLRKMSSQGEKSEQIKQPLKKPKLPEGRFDAPEDSNLEKEPLTSEYSEASLLIFEFSNKVF